MLAKLFFRGPEEEKSRQGHGRGRLWADEKEERKAWKGQAGKRHRQH